MAAGGADPGIGEVANEGLDAAGVDGLADVGEDEDVAGGSRERGGERGAFASAGEFE